MKLYETIFHILASIISMANLYLMIVKMIFALDFVDVNYGISLIVSLPYHLMLS